MRQPRGVILMVLLATGLVGCSGPVRSPDQDESAADSSTVPAAAAAPIDDLRFGEWIVSELDGQAVIDDSRATMTFSADGRASGHAGCNRFSGAYSLSGDTLSVGPLAATRMACDAAPMEQEQRFLAMLGAVTRVAFRADGALVLVTPDGREIHAERE